MSHWKIPLLVFVATCLFGHDLLAQVGGHDLKRPDVFQRSMEHAQKGWYITPGGTYMLGIDYADRTSLGGDTIRAQREIPTGKFGAFLQIGRFHALDSRWINYVDYGIDFRWLQGNHRREVETRLGADDPNWTLREGNGNFSDLWLGLTGNASFARHITNTIFISHSFGANVDYAIVRTLDYGGAYEGTVDYSPPVVSAQLHYKLGIGFKLNRGWYIMPTIETPMLGIYAWNDAIPALKYLDTYYQPILFGIQIMRRDKNKPEGCPPEGPTGKDRRRNTELWDKKMRR